MSEIPLNYFFFSDEKKWFFFFFNHTSIRNPSKLSFFPPVETFFFFVTSDFSWKEGNSMELACLILLFISDNYISQLSLYSKTLDRVVLCAYSLCWPVPPQTSSGSPDRGCPCNAGSHQPSCGKTWALGSPSHHARNREQFPPCSPPAQIVWLINWLL